jgi:CBS domain-containing protein
MVCDLVTVRPDDSLKHAAALLVEHRISGAPVCSPDGRVVGVISEGDILFKEHPPTPQPRGPLAWFVDGNDYESLVKRSARLVGEAMTSPAITIEPDQSVAEAARLMSERAVNRLPVVRDGALVGILTRADLVRAFVRSDEEIAREIRADVFERALWLPPDSFELEVSRGEVAISGHVERESDAAVVERLARRVPGVVSVSCRLTWPEADGRPEPQAGARI